jgi:hypothetical protein
VTFRDWLLAEAASDVRQLKKLSVPGKELTLATLTVDWTEGADRECLVRPRLKHRVHVLIELHASPYELLTTPLNIALVQGLATTGQPAQAIALADQALYVLLWVIFPRCAKGLTLGGCDTAP